MVEGLVSSVASILGKLTYPVVFGLLLVSGYFAFCPSGEARWGDHLVAFPVAVFLFSFGWLLVEIISDFRRSMINRRKASTQERRALFQDIYLMQKRFGGLSGMLSDKDHHFQAASMIRDKYSRLRKMGVSTPEIDLGAESWDFDFHNEFLTRVSAMLLHSQWADVKTEARSFLSKADDQPQ